MTIDEINIIRLALDTHRYEVDCQKNITDAKRILNKQEKAINYTRCCETFYCLKKEGVIENHEKCDKQCSYCKLEKSLQ